MRRDGLPVPPMAGVTHDVRVVAVGDEYERKDLLRLDGTARRQRRLTAAWTTAAISTRGTYPIEVEERSPTTGRPGFARSRLAGYKLPRSIELVQDPPVGNGSQARTAAALRLSGGTPTPNAHRAAPCG